MPLDLGYVEDRMATLAARIVHPDEREREYASVWLDKLWALYEWRIQFEREENK